MCRTQDTFAESRKLDSWPSQTDDLQSLQLLLLSLALGIARNRKRTGERSMGIR